MKAKDIILLCLAYILGLLLSPIKWGMYIVLGIGIMGGLSIPFLWKNAPKTYIWIIGGIVGLLSAFYLQTTIPQPAINDISKFVQKSDNWQQEQIVNIQGEILTSPKITRSGRSQFNLEVQTIHEIQNINNQPNDGIKKATGQLYVTVPILQSLGLYPGKKVAVIGVLYQPQKTTNPGSFDLGNYLAKNGIFSGLKGRQVIVPEEEKNNWGWWKIQQRIIKSLVKDLGTPEGILVSAMVLGNKVVDLPYYIADSFRQVGLSHALAASGFQVSLILGFIILITARFSPKIQFLIGFISLMILVGLTGVQPSIMRAVFMGIGALIALQQKRQVKILGSLFLSAIILLLWQPRWINDLGFQMSFLATFGLIVSANPLAKKLDFLPSAIANIIAVPIAATIWILPIQLYNFGVVSPYSIIVNILAIIPITIISIGGFISAIAGVIVPDAGSMLAALLYYPTKTLILLVDYFSKLPGNSVNIGQIAIYQLVTLYLLFSLVWLVKWWQKKWLFAAIMGTVLIIIPVVNNHINLFQFTLLSTSGDPVLIIQDKGKVTVINSGDENTVRYALLPFLRQQGINQIDLGLVVDQKANTQAAWKQILAEISVKNLYFNQVKELEKIYNLSGKEEISKQYIPLESNIKFSSVEMQLINNDPVILSITVNDKKWLILGNTNTTQKIISMLKPADILWWYGESLKPEILVVVEPKVAIASSPTIEKDTYLELSKNNVKIYSTGRDGALQWNPEQDFHLLIETPD